MENVKDYETYEKKVKFITGTTADEVFEKATEFEKNNKIINTIQKSEKLIIMFYWGKEDERSSNK